MFCKRETCAKIRFDFRVSPAGNISLQSLFQSIIQIFEPAQEIKIAFSCSRIFQPDIFVDQDVIPDETDIVSDQLPVTIIGEMTLPAALSCNSAEKNSFDNKSKWISLCLKTFR